MRMLDTDREESVRVLQLYLSIREATEFRKQLDRLLADPELNEHFHVFAEDMSREISCSIVTPRKLQPPHHYTDLELRILKEK